MDPQKLSQLDPKLREAYQRVMGTPVPQPQVDPIQAQTPPPPSGGPTPPMPDPTPIPPQPPEPEPALPLTGGPAPTIEDPPVAPQPAIPPTPEPALPQQSPLQAANFDQMNSEVAAVPSQNFAQPSPMAHAQTMAIKKKNRIMMPVLFGVVGLASIVVYTLFWTKIFNFKLPF